MEIRGKRTTATERRRVRELLEATGCDDDTELEDISCSRCRQLIAGDQEIMRHLTELGRPTTDTCLAIAGLHVHPMNRTRFTCRHFDPIIAIL